MRREIIEIYLPKKTFINLENATKVANKWGYNTKFRKKNGIITEHEFIFKQKDKSRYGNKEKVIINSNLSLLVGVKFK